MDISTSGNISAGLSSQQSLGVSLSSEQNLGVNMSVGVLEVNTGGSSNSNSALNVRYGTFNTYCEMSGFLYYELVFDVPFDEEVFYVGINDITDGGVTTSTFYSYKINNLTKNGFTLLAEWNGLYSYLENEVTFKYFAIGK